MFEIVPIAGVPAGEVEALLDRAFEPGRHARTAYRVREGTAAIAALSFAAVDGAALVGSIQCWPAWLAGADGARWPLVMVGPVAVAPERQGTGIGRALMARALAAADAAEASGRGPGTAALIGDPEYYGRFGFTAERTGAWTLPGPWEKRRLLARGADVPRGPGILAPRVTVPG